jgi:hypothetical protein
LGFIGLGERERRCCRQRRIGALVVLIALVALLGCEETAKSPPPVSPIPSAREDTRFIKIRNLLGQDPESVERATKLYPLVEPICTNEKERADFVEVAKWSSSFSIGHDTLPTVLALDTIEHVATSCARNYLDAAHDLLARAKAVVPDPYRYELITARIKAANGELAPALEAAKKAKDAGSIHALALTANIEAQIARGKAVGYTPGMLDDAIAMVSVEPTEKWQLIDLAAVLSTRARLLSERAIWEKDAAAIETRKKAAETYKRISVAPFIEGQRNPALDVMCFDAPELGDVSALEACKRAALEGGNLGGAVLAGVERDPAKLDLSRLEKLTKLAADLDALPKGSTVIVATRGDESELIAWARPASKVLARLQERGARIVLLDRTKNARAAALVDRMFALAGAKPVEAIRNADTLAMPCLAAIVGGRKTPAACPIPAAQVAKLEKLDHFAFALLIGRDLDAEIDDLKVYQHRTVLLSFRQTRIEKGLDAWAKSLADVWILAPGPKK